MFNRLIWSGVSALFLLVIAQAQSAQGPRVVQLEPQEVGIFQILEDTIVGHDTVDSVVRADHSEITRGEIPESTPLAKAHNWDSRYTRWFGLSPHGRPLDV